jgi:antitoxin VapB
MLNIKNPIAHDLAVEVAAATGESLTDAVIVALRERRDRLKASPQGIDRARVEGILTDLRAAMPNAFFETEDPTAFLYDPETGSPA